MRRSGGKVKWEEVSGFSGEGGESAESLDGKGIPSGGASLLGVSKLVLETWIRVGSPAALYE